MSPDDALPLKPDTTVIRAGRQENGSSLVAPIWPSAVWQTTCIDDAHQRATTVRASGFYGRYSNPTVSAFEQAVAELEGAEEAMAFGSGMGAVTSVILTFCSAGSHVVAARQIYSGTLAFLQGPARRFGIDTTFVDSTQPGAIAAAVRPGRTMLVIVETPSNPRLELCDLDEVGAISGPFTVVDSTFATPLGQQPLSHGIDIVLHSATKGISGHNDATLGVVAGEQDLINEIWSYGVLHGATASPYDAHNALRGIRTLGVRLERQARTSLRLATWLESHPGVSRTYYPGLASHPQHDLAKRQMREFGTMVAFELGGGADASRKVLDEISLIRCATSLGGPETLMTHPSTTTAVSLTPAEKIEAGVTDGLIRMSVGLEDSDDLIADLTSALA